MIENRHHRNNLSKNQEQGVSTSNKYQPGPGPGFPYLTNVLSGSMRPDFAADQAQAAILAMWQDAAGAEEDTDEE